MNKKRDDFSSPHPSTLIPHPLARRWVVREHDAGEAAWLAGIGIALGVVEGAPFVEQRATIGPGEKLVLYTATPGSASADALRLLGVIGLARVP